MKNYLTYRQILILSALVLIIWLPSQQVSLAEIQGTLRVYPAAQLHRINPGIYGHHLEHFGRIIQGGLWAELLRNRKFVPIDPDRSHVAEPWQAEVDRSHVSYAIDRSETLNGISSQRISLFGETKGWQGIRQSGFDVLKAKEYTAYAWIKTNGSNQSVSFRLESPDEQVGAHAEMVLQPGDWRKYEVKLQPDRDLRPAVFRLAFNSLGSQWIGAVSLMPSDNVEGMRADVLELIKILRPSIIRWPGGGYPDSYDWRKAIGPRDQRVPQAILPFGQPYGYDHGMDPNDFGTDEFLKFCQLIGAEPYITANFGSGTPEMAAAWVEYCNGSPDSQWGAKRAAIGRAEPYRVKHWSIGNEIWGPFESGHTNAEGYSHYFVPIAKAMRSKDPTLEITAVGQFDHSDFRAWNEFVLKNALDQIDLLSIHHYYPGGFLKSDFRNNPLQLYRAVVAEPTLMERRLQEVISLMDRISSDRKKFQIALDEWSEWDWEYEQVVDTPHRSAVNQFIDLVNKSGLEFNQTHRDGLFGARMLQTMMRLGDRIPIGIRTHIINSLGAIRTDSTRAFITAPGVVMQLYRNHSGTTLVRVEAESTTFDVPENGWTDIPFLDATATASADGHKLFLHMINLHADQTMQVSIEISGQEIRPQGTVWQIAPADYLSRNDFEVTNVRLARLPVDGLARQFTQQLPPHSATTLEMDLK